MVQINVCTIYFVLYTNVPNVAICFKILLKNYSRRIDQLTELGLDQFTIHKTVSPTFILTLMSDDRVQSTQFMQLNVL